jgi:hypothetical protein
VRRAAVVVTFACAAVMTPRVALACGAAYPGGPVMCEYPRSAASGGQAPRPIARVSASYAYTSTTLLFGEGRRADLTRHSAFGAIEVPLASKLSLQLGAGGVAGGELAYGDSRAEIGPGWSGFAGVAGRVIDGKGPWPFVQLTGTLSTTRMITRTQTEAPRYTAFDARVGGIVGKTFAGGASGASFTPYAVGRVFGGPVYWRFDGADVTGTDLYKYQVGGGLSVSLFDRRLDVFAEGIALGERGMAVGVGTTFF